MGPLFIVSADLNNDNHSDMIITYDDYGIIGVVLGESDGSFVFSDWYFTPKYSFTTGITIADVKNDRNLDKITSHLWSNYGGIFIAKGNETLSQVIIYPTGDKPHSSSLAALALNHDHRNVRNILIIREILYCAS